MADHPAQIHASERMASSCSCRWPHAVRESVRCARSVSAVVNGEARVHTAIGALLAARRIGAGEARVNFVEPHALATAIIKNSRPSADLTVGCGPSSYATQASGQGSRSPRNRKSRPEIRLCGLRAAEVRKTPSRASVWSDVLRPIPNGDNVHLRYVLRSTYPESLRWPHSAYNRVPAVQAVGYAVAIAAPTSVQSELAGGGRE
jgi:hypothetical protein